MPLSELIPTTRSDRRRRGRTGTSEQKTANNNALALTRSLVPPDILKSTAKDAGLRICDALQSDDKPALALARRVWSAKALRAVRRAPSELLRKAHAADLRGTYTPTGLDIVELRAVYACLPKEFANDADGAKAAWRESVREKLVAMVAKEAAGQLTASEKKKQRVSHLPDFVRLFPSEACDAGWRPDAATRLARGPRRGLGAPAGLLAARGAVAGGCVIIAVFCFSPRRRTLRARASGPSSAPHSRAATTRRSPPRSERPPRSRRRAPRRGRPPRGPVCRAWRRARRRRASRRGLLTLRFLTRGRRVDEHKTALGRRDLFVRLPLDPRQMPRCSPTARRAGRARAALAVIPRTRDSRNRAAE